MINRTTGIVLRVSPFSRTSHVVSWLTPDHGRLSTAVKGAMRPRSAFLGQYDLFYSCEFLYYARERGGAHILKECCPVDTRDRLRADWRAALCASYFCDFAGHSCPPGAPNPDFFLLLDRALAFLGPGSASVTTLVWFELRAMDVVGLAPGLAQCMDCNRKLPSGDSPAEFSCSKGGVLCAECAGRHTDSAYVSVSGRALTIMQELQGKIPPRVEAKGNAAGPEHAQIANLTGTFLDYHAHGGLPSRSIALELLH